MKLIEFVNTINKVDWHPPLYIFARGYCENDSDCEELGHYDKNMTKYDNREILEIGLIDESISLVLGPEEKQMTRLEWLMQDKEKLLRFIDMVSKGEQDCGYCPFVSEDGILPGCCYGDPENEWEIQDCRMIDNDIDDFLQEQMPTEEQMKEWKKRSEELEYEKKNNGL